MSTIAKAVGFRWFERSAGPRGRWELRFSWAEFYGGLGLGLALCLFEEGYSLHIQFGWPNMFIKLPFLKRWAHDPECGMEQWGFKFFERSVHLNWGGHCKIVHLPWSWQHVRHQVHLRDGTLVAPTPHHYEPPYPEGRYVETHLYRYTLRNGTVQNRTATIYGDEREWRWRWFQWLPRPRKISRCIEITFSDEVGERTGSWKGGCIGCGYEWRHGEEMLDALRRMERERKF